MLQKNLYQVVLFACCAFLFSCKKGGSGPDPAPPPLPVLSVQDAVQNRTTTASVMRFYVTLNKKTTHVAKVNYTLVDGSAVSPKDYVSAPGTVTIAANQTQATIEIPISGDPTDKRQENLDFSLQLSNPESCVVIVPTAKGTIITENGINLATDNSGYSTPMSYPGYTLSWSDEFSGAGLDMNAWNQEIGNGGNGWGNNELEYYTSSSKNILVTNGNLVIEARKEAINGFNYSSGRMTTQNKKAFKFGRIDIRAKLPVGKGIWPALWMLGNNISSVGWPSCGEIDIMELIGTFPSRSYGTMHWKPVTGTNTSKGGEYNLASGNFSQQFHVFSIVWAQDAISWYIDDQLFFSTSSADVGAANYPFNAEQFLIFNVAVGGNWPGSPDANTVFPQRMFVDYVRVFQ